MVFPSQVFPNWNDLIQSPRRAAKIPGSGWKYFSIYAETCFSCFGDRVKSWVTFNEPLQTAVNGYGTGIMAPGRSENSSTEPYLAAHYQLLAHAAAVSIYRKNFKAQQGGEIGLVVDCEWAEAFSDKMEDKIAAARRLDFQLGWFLDPIYYGDYPETMRKRLGNRLPKFSEKDKEILKNSADFVGLNHYTSRFIAHITTNPEHNDFYEAQQIERIEKWPGGEVIGERAASEWLFVVPWGIEKVLNYIAQRYHNPPIYVTENGGPRSWRIARNIHWDNTERVRKFHLPKGDDASCMGKEISGLRLQFFSEMNMASIGKCERYGHYDSSHVNCGASGRRQRPKCKRFENRNFTVRLMSGLWMNLGHKRWLTKRRLLKRFDCVKGDLTKSSLFLLGWLKSEQRIKTYRHGCGCFMDVDASCLPCGIADDTIYHLLLRCPFALKVVFYGINPTAGNSLLQRKNKGMDDEDSSTTPLHEVLDDKQRLGYFKGYLAAVAQSIRDGADIRGYFAWSFVDNFEWAQGYTKRFGLVYVDYENGLSRHPKSSALWFSRFLKAEGKNEKID
ncbi:hypothetical protein GIB67_032866 [Kingdonia uniflora]|uniref:Beta-glucosidase n=1 Tax=Kingdonia uniflora TaxID=39325 RepID=A0A7J7NCQ5_9MAGN|nr:hypothetical protein GIB67_032866 [Kingdonia uniflora]